MSSNHFSVTVNDSCERQTQVAWKWRKVNWL